LVALVTRRHDHDEGDDGGKTRQNQVWNHKGK
jgi:hypothetical protein